MPISNYSGNFVSIPSTVTFSKQQFDTACYLQLHKSKMVTHINIEHACVYGMKFALLFQEKNNAWIGKNFQVKFKHLLSLLQGTSGT